MKFYKTFAVSKVVPLAFFDFLRLELESCVVYVAPFPAKYKFITLPTN